MKTKYHLYTRADGELDSRHLCTLEGHSLDAIRTALEPLMRPDGSAAVDALDRFKKLSRRPGRPVRVVAVHAHRAYREAVVTPRVGEEFESLTDFAEALGSTVNNASVAIGKARAKGECTAVVRGVEFGYVDMLPRTDTVPLLGPLSVLKTPMGELVGRNLGPESHPLDPPPAPPGMIAVASQRPAQPIFVADPAQNPSLAVPPGPSAPRPKRILVPAGDRNDPNRPRVAEASPPYADDLADAPEPPDEVST